MILRVNNFGAENAAAIAVNALAVAAFGKIGEFAALLAEKGETRASAAETKLSKSAHRKLMRKELGDDLKAISRAGTDIEINNPAFDNVFRVPRKNLNDAVLIETARAVHTNASPEAIKNLFIGYGLLDDFLEDLQDDTDAFEAAISQQDTANRERIGANSAIDDIIDEVLRAVGTLKVIVPNIFRNDPGKLAEWTAASHVEKPPRKKKGGNNPPTS